MNVTTTTTGDSVETPRCLRLHPDDNVAVMLNGVELGPVIIMDLGAGATVDAAESIASGHKIALQPIGVGEVVVKYGVAIGYATIPIAAGRWVHTHNCRSGLDERSHTLDPHTGAPTDTQYA
jgi:altronate dehydratase small subunit